MMPTSFPNLDLPLVDPNTGRINKAWYQLLASMYLLLGGTDPIGTPDLAVQSGLMDENFSATIELENKVDALHSEIAMGDALAARVAELKKVLDELGQMVASATDAAPLVAELANRVNDLENILVFTDTPHQEITLSGDVTGYGTYSITVTLANSGVNAGTYQGLTVDAKGRVTAASSIPYARTDQANTWVGTQTYAGITVTALTVKGQVAYVQSGSASSYAAIVTGRTGSDTILGTAAAANDLVNGTAAGDTALNANVTGARIIVAINGTEVARHTSDGGFRCAQLRTTQTPAASTTASNYSVPIDLNGTIYYMRLSSTA